MIKVSILIPVYNVERYLRQCLESAMQQTLQEIEILCINDGSTDGSAAILEQMAAQDSRIQIVNKANSGYGSTMNQGIDMAHGKYLVFLESDDFILPDMCQVLYELCERHDLDMAKTDFYEFKTNGEQICARYRQVSDYKNYHEVLNPQKNTEVFYASMYTWTCMYRREFLDQFQIRHQETPGASYQDNGFWFQTMMYCRRIYLLDQAFYMYRQDNPESSIHSKGKVHAFSEEYAFIRKNVEAYKGNTDKRVFWEICAFFNIHHNLNSLSRVDKQYTQELIQMIVDEVGLYKGMGAWQIKDLSHEFLQKVLFCMMQQSGEVQKGVWDYIDQHTARRKVLEAYPAYILYGAGIYAGKVLDVLEECKMWDKELLCGVTDLENAPKEIRGLEVGSIEELLQRKNDALVIVCAKKNTEAYGQMCENLRKWKVDHMISADELFLSGWWQI